MSETPGWTTSQSWRPWPSHITTHSPAIATSTLLPSAPPAGDFNRMNDEDVLIQLRANMLKNAELLGALSGRVAHRRQLSMKREVEFAEVQALTARAKSLFEKEMEDKKQVVNQHKTLLEDHEKLRLHSTELEEKLTQSEKTLFDQKSQIQTLTQALSAKNFQTLDLEKALAEKGRQAQEALAKLAEAETCHETISQENSLLKEKLAEEHKSSSERFSDLSWMLQKGVPGILRIFLTSDEFVNRNTSLQQESVRLGQYQGCLDTRGAYPDSMKDKPLIYDFPHSEQSVSDLFTDLVTSNYDLIQSFEKGLVDLSELKNIIAGLPSGPEDMGDSSSHPQ